MKWLNKLWYGITHDTLFLIEIAYQCKCLDENNPDGCEDCEGTGVIRYGSYSECWIVSIERMGHKHMWTRWNPIQNYKL